MNTYSVYRFTFPNGKLYFGITSAKNILHRWGRDGIGYSHMLVGRAIQKYGWDNIQKDVLYSEITEEEAKQIEIDLIAKYRTTDIEFGYNVTSGGESLSGYVITDEHRNKLKEYAKHRSPDHIAKLSQANTGKKFTEEHRHNISIHRKGIKHSEEAKAKIGYASRHRSPEAKENHRRSLIGHQVSEETRQKLSDAQKGVPKPEWLKERFKEGQRRAAQNPEILEKRNRGRSKPIVCTNNNHLYKTMDNASKGEGISSERVNHSVKTGQPVKGLCFIQFPRGTSIESILSEHSEYILIEV